MSFEQLLNKVTQAEQALEAQERHLAADWRQFKRSWIAAWTPGRIVGAGLISGFLIGRAQPLKHASGSGTLQLLSTVASLFAGGSAQVAAGEAEHAVKTAERTLDDTSATLYKTETLPPTPAAASPQPYEVPDTFRGSGQL